MRKPTIDLDVDDVRKITELLYTTIDVCIKYGDLARGPHGAWPAGLDNTIERLRRAAYYLHERWTDASPETPTE